MFCSPKLMVFVPWVGESFLYKKVVASKGYAVRELLDKYSMWDGGKRFEEYDNGYTISWEFGNGELLMARTLLREAGFEQMGNEAFAEQVEL